MTSVDRALAAVSRASFVVGPLPNDDAVAPAIGAGHRGTPIDTVRRLVLDAGIEPGQRVLELGAGTGFMSAVLSEMGAIVHGVEREPELLEQAHRALSAIGSSAHIHLGDARQGWQAAAPYDAIIATFAVRTLPSPWLRQLATPGVLVAPIGAPEGSQELTRFVRSADGRLERQGRGPCRFEG